MNDLAGVNIAELFTKIILRNDVAEAWETSTVVLEQGEPALEIDLDRGLAKFKIGDGKHAFKDLPYSTITPDEIQEMIDKAIVADEISSAIIKSISLSSGTNKGTLKFTVNNEVIDNIEVTGLGSAAFTNASDYATAEQGKKADNAMAFKGTVGSLDATVEKLPNIGISKGDTYKAVSSFNIAANASYNGSDLDVYPGDMIIALDENKWINVPSGKTVTEVNTDVLVNGQEELVLNGGLASF
jgi:hypothetical protein